MEEGRSVFKILTGKPTGKRSLGKPGLDGKTIREREEFGQLLILDINPGIEKERGLGCDLVH